MQKQAIIDQYILGKGLTEWYPLGIVVGIALLLYYAQDYFWRRRVNQLNKEIGRLGKWKSDRQQAQIGTDLHHTRQK